MSSWLRTAYSLHWCQHCVITFIDTTRAKYKLPKYKLPNTNQATVYTFLNFLACWRYSIPVNPVNTPSEGGSPTISRVSSSFDLPPTGGKGLLSKRALSSPSRSWIAEPRTRISANRLLYFSTSSSVSSSRCWSSSSSRSRKLSREVGWESLAKVFLSWPILRACTSSQYLPDKDRADAPFRSATSKVLATP
jgi:hypothetical protein